MAADPRSAPAERNQSIPLPAGRGDPSNNYERVKDAVSVVDFARREVPEFSEKSLRGCCPVHPNSDNPSIFLANVESRTYRCFKCGFRGTIIDLEMALRRCTEWEALVGIAEDYGVELRRGRSADWHAGTGARKSLAAGIEDDVVEHLTERIFALYCGDYTDGIADDDERDEAIKALWETCWRRAKDYRDRARAAGRAGEVSEDAS